MGNITQVIAAVAILVTPPAQADLAVRVSLDTNMDGVVNADELRDLVRKVVAAFDEDGDGRLRRSDLHRLVFHLWDADDNLFLDQTEYDRARSWGTGLGANDFGRLDGDGNKLLSPLEFTAFGELEMYDRWDVDDSLLFDHFEVAGELLSMFDANEDGVLDAKELEEVPLVWPVSSRALTTIVAG